MLQVPFIRDNRDLVISGLKKRNIDATEDIDQVILLDENGSPNRTKESMDG